jgi:hypothetical protein
MLAAPCWEACQHSTGFDSTEQRMCWERVMAQGCAAAVFLSPGLPSLVVVLALTFPFAFDLCCTFDFLHTGNTLLTCCTRTHMHHMHPATTLIYNLNTGRACSA